MESPFYSDINYEDYNIDSLCQALYSIGLEQVCLSETMEQEAEKINAVAGRWNNESSIKEIVDLNSCVEKNLIELIKQELLLQYKLEKVIEALNCLAQGMCNKTCEESVCEETICEESELELPICDEPECDDPVFELQTCEEPVFKEPEIKLATCDEPECEEQVFKQPMCEEPVYEEPGFELPISEEPVCEKPILDLPICEEPVCKEPLLEPPICKEPEWETLIYQQPEHEDPHCISPINAPPAAKAPSFEHPACEVPAVQGLGYIKKLSDKLIPVIFKNYSPFASMKAPSKLKKDEAGKPLEAVKGKHKSGIKAEIKTEFIFENKTEDKAKIKPKVKTEDIKEVKPEIKNEVKPKAKPEVKQDTEAKLKKEVKPCLNCRGQGYIWEKRDPYYGGIAILQSCIENTHGDLHKNGLYYSAHKGSCMLNFTTYPEYLDINYQDSGEAMSIVIKGVGQISEKIRFKSDTDRVVDFELTIWPQIPDLCIDSFQIIISSKYKKDFYHNSGLVNASLPLM